MWLSALTWLTGSRAGRTLAAVLAGAAALGLLLLRAYGAGKRSERLAQSSASVEAIRTKLAVDRDLHTLTPEQRRAELSKWSR